MPMSLGKVKENIKKLLRMASDTGSPHEAAIAARRARKLMDQYNLHDVDPNEDSLRYGRWVDVENARHRIPTWYSILLVAIAQYNDCIVQYTYEPDKPAAAEFLGEESDLMMCEYMMDAIANSIRIGARRYLKENGGGRAAANAYRVGFAREIVDRLNALTKERAAEIESSGTALTINRKFLVEQHFGIKEKFSKRRIKVSDQSAIIAGGVAGKRMSINNPISNKHQKALTHKR